MSTSESDNFNEDTQSDIVQSAIVQAAKSVTANLLPQKSREKYESAYEKLMEWKKNTHTASFSENVLLTYFHDLSKKFKPSTLWAQYSMLKSTINNTNNIDIGSYKKLTEFLKTQSTGFKSQKSQVFTSEEVERFLNTAPDDQYLATKCALIFGIVGACRREELCHIDIQDINDTGSMAVVFIRKTKNYIPQSFTIIGKFYNTFKKYAALRPNKTTSTRFFLNYQHGKCTQQVIGINKFGAMPKQIATFLQLSNPESYTGHSFRRTSATLLADSGANIQTIKRHSIGWKPNQVTDGYIEAPMNNTIVIKKEIMDGGHIPQLPSDDDDDDSTLEEIIPEKRQRINIKHEIIDEGSMSENEDEPNVNYGPSTSITNEKSTDTNTLSFTNCTNVTIHIYNYKKNT